MSGEGGGVFPGLVHGTASNPVHGTASNLVRGTASCLVHGTASGFVHGTASGFVRGTAVEVGGRALLLAGPSGCGKSSIALELVSRGARLVADDGVWLRPDPKGPWVQAPRGAGRIEARGLGLLPAPHTSRARLVAVVDLSREEEERLPPDRRVEMGGASLRLLHGSRSPAFAAALHVYLLSHAE